MEPVVSIRGVDHTYGTGSAKRQILFDATADLAAGEIVILRGPSGAGKTTLLTLVGALRSVQSGSIHTLGHELRGARDGALLAIRNQIGFIFQAQNLLESLTVCQNVQTSLEHWPHLFRGKARERSIEALAAVGLADRLNDLPHSLSGGQKQRVAIARALVRRPKLILADEPTSALDRKSGREIVDILQESAKRDGCTILMVTHDSRVLDVADRILTLEDGRLSSFTSGIAADTGDLLAAFTHLNRNGDLVRRVRMLNDAEFVSLLERTTGEFERFLQVLDGANQDALRALVEQTLEAVTIRIRDRMGAENAAVYLVDEEAGKLWSRVFSSAMEEALRVELPIGSGLVGKAAVTGQTVSAEDAGREPDSFLTFGEIHPELRSVLCVPLRDRQGKIIAVARFLNKQGRAAFSQEDADKFREFARPMGIILESCRRLMPR
ncbi:MAG TPA: ATP-binding cassette domain-containing protein [Acidobacteriota bacterium]|nr:ATP-binding cassette domain-containing protein [Acidobacteriota bacterium]